MTAEEILEIIEQEYNSCPNIVGTDGRLYCYTWYRHDDCVRLMLLLNRITNNSKYTLPEIREEVKEAIHKMLEDPNMDEVLKRLKD